MISIKFNGCILCFRANQLKSFFYNPETEPRQLILHWFDGVDTVILGDDAEDCYQKLHKHYGVIS